MSGGSCLQKADALDVQRSKGRRLCSGWGLVAPYAQEANKIEDAPLRAWETKSVHAHQTKRGSRCAAAASHHSTVRRHDEQAGTLLLGRSRPQVARCELGRSSRHIRTHQLVKCLSCTAVSPASVSALEWASA